MSEKMIERILDAWRYSGEHLFWVFLMGFLVILACGLLGNYFVMRRMALMGDAISHSILPGVVIAFLLTNRVTSFSTYIGALLFGVLATVVIEFIHRRSLLKEDAAMGVTFSAFFALGVVLISACVHRIDLDLDCVLFGSIELIPQRPFLQVGGWEIMPRPVFFMGLMSVLVILCILIFYKEMLVTSFDAQLAASLGVPVSLFHYGLMSLLSMTVVSAFESVGAILVVAMIILPASTAYLLSARLKSMLLLTGGYALLSSFLGLHLGLLLGCSTAASMVVAGFFLFLLAWAFSPQGGFVWKLSRLSSRKTRS